MSGTDPSTADTPATPRLSATILLLRDNPLEVLMTRRHSRQVFASALVFPGGLVDSADMDDAWLDLVDGADQLDPVDRALRIAGIRETFEETGILLARDESGSHRAPTVCRERFIDVVRDSGLRLALDDLVHFGHWITPDALPRRFDTHFFLCRSAEDQQAVCDGREVVALEWARPDAILSRAEAGETSIMFPTHMNIARLAESGSVQDAIAAARCRPRFTVHARMERRGNRKVSVIPAEAGYPAVEYLHSE